jgi:hypothetical protein
VFIDVRTREAGGDGYEAETTSRGAGSGSGGAAHDERNGSGGGESGGVSSPKGGGSKRDEPDAAARGRGDDGGGGEEQDRDGDEHERGGSDLRRRAFFGESSGSLGDSSVSAARFEELREFEARRAALKALVNSPRPPARRSVVVGRWPSLLRASAKTFRSRRFSSFASTAEEAAAAVAAGDQAGPEGVMTCTGVLTRRKESPSPPASDNASATGRTYDDITESPPPHLRCAVSPLSLCHPSSGAPPRFYRILLRQRPGVEAGGVV